MNVPSDGSQDEKWESWHPADVNGGLIVVICFLIEEENKKETVLTFLVTEPNWFVKNLFDVTCHLTGNV